jgi:membrane protease YdiL (CAAX protease family)
MVRQANISLPVLIIMAMVNGTFEEVFLLGFLQRGLRNYGPSVALGVTLLVRLMYHLYQGPIGAVWITGFGLVFGLFYLRFQALWPVVLAHILWDIVPFTAR